jgi:hypothetical protein
MNFCSKVSLFSPHAERSNAFIEEVDTNVYFFPGASESEMLIYSDSLYKRKSF